MNLIFSKEGKRQNSKISIRWSGSSLAFCCVLFAIPATAQHKTSTVHAPKTANSTTSSKLPRSVPSSAVQVVGANTNASRQQLNRLEHMSVKPLKTTSAPRSAKTAGAPPVKVSTSNDKSVPINFSYRGPKPGEAAHRNASGRNR